MLANITKEASEQSHSIDWNDVMSKYKSSIQEKGKENSKPQTPKKVCERNDLSTQKEDDLQSTNNCKGVDPIPLPLQIKKMFLKRVLWGKGSMPTKDDSWSGNDTFTDLGDGLWEDYLNQVLRRKYEKRKNCQHQTKITFTFLSMICGTASVTQFFIRCAHFHLFKPCN